MLVFKRWPQGQRPAGALCQGGLAGTDSSAASLPCQSQRVGFFPPFSSFILSSLTLSFSPSRFFLFFKFSPWVPRSPSHRWVLRPCAHCLPGLPRASQMGACAPVPSPDFCAWRSGDTQVAWSGGQQGSHWCPLWVVCLHVLEKGGLRVWLPGRADVGGDREPPLWDTVGSWHSLHSGELLK